MYIDLNSYLRERFGCKVYKLALSGGFTCPNRDGTLDTRGCIFCSCSGSGEFCAHGESVGEQIENAKQRVAKKAGKDCKYIAYFQNFTNTYAPIDYLERIYTEAVSHPDIVAVSIATRPDCLPDEVMALLRRINAIKPVWVELGLQTIHERTAEYIRRCYPLSVYDDAVKRLHECGIEVITHVIIGLPGETREQVVQTAKYVSDIGSDGIKLQLLHILRGTDLAKEYERGMVKVLSLEEYVDILKACVDVLRDDIVVHRLTGDGAKRDLIAPLWSADKKRVMAAISRALGNRAIRVVEIPRAEFL